MSEVLQMAWNRMDFAIVG